MIAWLWNILFLFITIGVLVTVHEFGHFWVARRLGVRVLTFSIGFGSALWSRRAADGVEYRIAAIPLGGYVKMLDEREADVPTEQLPQAFNRQSVWTRIAVALAGPVANFLFAIIAFAAMYMVGIRDLKPVLGDVAADSAAAAAGLRAGMEVVAVDDEAVQTWEELTFALVARVGSERPVELQARDNGAIGRYRLPAGALDLSGYEADIAGHVGLRGRSLPWPAIINSLDENGAAKRAGIQVGDVISLWDGEPVSGFPALTEKITAAAGKTVTLRLLRADAPLDIAVTIADDNGRGRLGVGSVRPATPDDWLVLRQLGLWDALVGGWHKMVDTSALVLDGLSKLVTGKLSLKSLSGPVTIAEGAGATAAAGPDRFFWFLGLISVNLGLINLMPIPMLDGGHLLYFGVEAVRGRPLSERVQEWGLRIGVALVGALMLIALFNDFARP
ncbi:RIP metalloprotease RseP [Permianibacter sp. IMCC34836]|uniref:RIP metalloprotease RseP n=1 Tax=Permianibacter fluminis TaxID=2738515 RepID=UPI0015526F1A|nr:RIP metalloprotease RseP [Permianibacter fluminis]NQD38684.1 RIP metalloprotease RseP [Permianibacter fluminis]